jgi:uncharacterized protein (DUF934 family)
MPLVRHGAIVEDDYVRILDDSPVPEDGAAIVPASRLLADAGDLTRRGGRTGVLWPNDLSVLELEPYLAQLTLIALIFPTFRDGRAYSQARLLRERLRFRGELRATGQVLRDQFLIMHRAGFDSYEVKKPADAEAFVAAIDRYSVFYQPTGDGRIPAFRRRAKNESQATDRLETKLV